MVTALAGLLYGMVSPGAREMATSTALATPWFVAAGLGVLLQVFAWVKILKGGTLQAGLLWLATLGWVAGLLGMTIVREGIRLQAVDLDELAELVDVDATLRWHDREAMTPSDAAAETPPGGGLIT